MSMIANLEKLLATGPDSTMLRFGLGQAYLKECQPEAAMTHLRKALEIDPHYSAAWKLLGKSLAEQDLTQEAIETYEQGIQHAEAKGDIQAAKEMKVFLKRLQK